MATVKHTPLVDLLASHIHPFQHVLFPSAFIPVMQFHCPVHFCPILFKHLNQHIGQSIYLFTRHSMKVRTSESFSNWATTLYQKLCGFLIPPGLGSLMQLAGERCSSQTQTHLTTWGKWGWAVHPQQLLLLEMRPSYTISLSCFLSHPEKSMTSASKLRWTRES